MSEKEPIASKSPPNRGRLNDRFVRTVKPEAKRKLHWDTVQQGLVLCVEPTGHKSYKLIYTFNNHPRWYTIAQRIKAREIPQGDITLFLDTHGWLNDQIEKREQIRQDILAFGKEFNLIRINMKFPVAKTRKRLNALRSRLIQTAKQLAPPEPDFIDQNVGWALYEADKDFDPEWFARHLELVADLCVEAGISLGRLQGGQVKDRFTRAYADRCWDFLEKWEVDKNRKRNGKLKKSRFKEVTVALYTLIAGVEEPGMRHAIDDVWSRRCQT